MMLYHFANPDHLPFSLEAGFLKTTESNVSLKRERAGPDVAWLTTKDSVRGGNGLDNRFHEKAAIRFTVELDRRSVHKWPNWARGQGSPQQVMEALAKDGGSGTWRATTRTIPAAQWVEIRNMLTGELIT